MALYKAWTQEEETYLQDNWGSKSVTKIADNLNRPYGGVRRKAAELNLLEPTLHFDGITVRQLMMELGVSNGTAKMWISQYGFPAKYKVFVKKQRVYVVRFDDFWKWAEQHKYLINFAKLEPLILGKEPDWVAEKRKIDRLKFIEKRPWTDEDKAKLLQLVNSFYYTYPEISAILKRPESSIKRKLVDLKVKARPVSLDRNIKYTSAEILKIIDMLEVGYSFNAISDFLNQGKPRYQQKSARGIRGKLQRMGFHFLPHERIIFKFCKGANDMNPFFIRSSVKKINFSVTITDNDEKKEEVRERFNWPINLSLCKYIEKSTYQVNEDNANFVRPSIRFAGCDAHWVYNNEEERNAEFKKLITNTFNEQFDLEEQLG